MGAGCRTAWHAPGTSADTLLGALDTAAEAGKTRALILIDGINEGVGSHFWRSHLAGFLAKIKTYRHVACILSCRSEYVQHAFPKELYEGAARFEVVGFATPEEQFNAARVYKSDWPADWEVPLRALRNRPSGSRSSHSGWRCRRTGRYRQRQASCRGPSACRAQPPAKPHSRRWGRP